MQCFLSSNLLVYPNISEFIQEHRAYGNLRTKVVYAPDTNLYYNQFLSNGHIRIDEFVCIDSVQKEITRMLNKKFSPKHITELKQQVPYQKNLLDEFVNRRMKPSRKAANLALQEYLKHSSRVHAMISTKELVIDKEQNDVIFVEAVKEYQRNSNTYPIILTCDKLLTDLCDSLGVSHFHLEIPKAIPPEVSTPEKLCNLICSLAGVLGVIQVNKTIILGEYRGKKDHNEYKLQYLSGQAPLELERDLEISRELAKLNINY